MEKRISTCNFIISLIDEESKTESKYTDEHKKLLCTVLNAKTKLLNKIYEDKL